MKHTPGPSVISEARSTKVDLINTRTGIDAVHPTDDREHIMVLLREWKQHHDAVDKLLGGLETTIGLNYGGPLFETVWKLFDSYTHTLAVEVGDFDGWLEWFFPRTTWAPKPWRQGLTNRCARSRHLTICTACWPRQQAVQHEALSISSRISQRACQAHQAIARRECARRSITQVPQGCKSLSQGSAFVSPTVWRR